MSDANVSPLKGRMEDLQRLIEQQKKEIESLRLNGNDNDKSERRAHTAQMTDISRSELEARLEAIETRMDSRLALTNAKIDSFLAAQADRDRAAQDLAAERDKRMEERIAASITLSAEWNQKFRILTEQSVAAAKSADESAKQAANLKNHFWASVGVQFLGVAAILVAAYFANQQIGIGFAQIIQSIYESAPSATGAIAPAK